MARYRLAEQVGAGGMAMVFRARDERLGRLVALKIMAPALAADEVFRQRFIREWRAAAAVDDPHIIPVYEAGQAGRVLFLAMRFVSGGDVRSLVRREGPLAPSGRQPLFPRPPRRWTPRTTRDWSTVTSSRRICCSMGALDGQIMCICSDFGLSKGALSSGGLTGAGQFLGTPNYTAPEQIEGLPVMGGPTSTRWRVQRLNCSPERRRSAKTMRWW
jgi:serine/threonine-protein kinase